MPAIPTIYNLFHCNPISFGVGLIGFASNYRERVPVPAGFPSLPPPEPRRTSGTQTEQKAHAKMKFTAEMARTMTPAQVRAFWAQRQIESAAKGEPHYEKLICPVSGKILVDITATVTAGAA